jgi:hypothetical protein
MRRDIIGVISDKFRQTAWEEGATSGRNRSKCKQNISCNRPASVVVWSQNRKCSACDLRTLCISQYLICLQAGNRPTCTFGSQVGPCTVKSTSDRLRHEAHRVRRMGPPVAVVTVRSRLGALFQARGSLFTSKPSFKYLFVLKVVLDRSSVVSVPSWQSAYNSPQRRRRSL